MLDWKRRLLEVHPRPNDRISSDALDAAVDLALEHLPARIDRITWFILMAGVAARLGDSHTAVVPPRELTPFRLPLVVEDDALCFESPTGGVPAGACLLALGNFTADEVLAWSRRLASAETRPGIDRAVPRTLPALLHAFGYTERCSVRVRTPDETVVEATLTPGDHAAVERDAVTVERLPSDIVVLTVRTLVMTPEDDLRRAFEQIFAQLSHEPPRGLIIDVRDNDGGSTAVAESLLSYVTERPHRMFAKKYWKVSEPMQQHIEDQGIAATAYLEATPGDALIQGVKLGSAPASPHRFEGPTVFLIGPDTLSAAMMMVDAVREYDLGLLVGEPTSSPPTYFGEVYTYRMPHSGLVATISSAAFLRASGDFEMTGPVFPHVMVESRLADRLAGRDEALAVATQWVHTHTPSLGTRPPSPIAGGSVRPDDGGPRPPMRAASAPRDDGPTTPDTPGAELPTHSAAVLTVMLDHERVLDPR